ncbi:MAG: MFS transporter [Muribaculaceae bacterium]|nr:MFS transporter [Muribaculaceae bacterium]
MKYVDNGKGNEKIPLMSLIAILSISLTVNLPGLAITPVMGKIKEVFYPVSELEVELLSSLPNLVIIPIILWTGRLSLHYRKVAILATGLLIFLAGAVAYLFADSLLLLILLGCLVGIGCGFVIPLAAGMISDNFHGSRNAAVLGMKSGTSNGAVIIATIFVGWVAAHNWHLAFLVYLIPIVPLVLLPFMSKEYIDKNTIDTLPDSANTTSASKSAAHTAEEELPQMSNRERVLRLFAIMGVYITITYSTTSLFYCLPFTMAHYKLSTSAVGIATAMFYAAAMIFGFALPGFKRIFRDLTMPVSIFITLGGMVLMMFVHTLPAYVIGVFMTGVGYGIVQPMIYNKTTALAPNPSKNTQYFAYVLTGNYIAIAAAPFFVKLVATICHTTTEASPDFAINLAAVVTALLLGISLLFIKDYAFKTER